MSDSTKDGGPAFPYPNEHYPNGEVEYGSNGMSLRDWFAGQALAGICSNPNLYAFLSNVADKEGCSVASRVSDHAFWLADFMLVSKEDTTHV